VSGVDEIRAQALEVAAGWSAPDAPESWRLTAGVLEAIAAHAELLEGLAVLPADRLPALLASAATSWIVAREQPQPLAGYFPEPGGPQPGFDHRFFAAASAFFSARRDDVVAVCQGRRYQMNEVARCAQVALGIAATAPDEPVTLVDLGTGAGLGLHLDRYRYQVGARAFGSAAAGLSLPCELRGTATPERWELPPITDRAGIELRPVDLNDPASRAWLQACTPPEASALSRLTAAIEVARDHPATIVAGDVIAALPGVLGALPPHRPVVVTDAYLAVFLTGEQRAELIAILADAARTRPVTWLSLDPLVPLGPTGDQSVQGLALPASLVRDYQQHGVFALLSARAFPDDGAGRLLARAHPSGQWVEWIDTAAGITDATARHPRTPMLGDGRHARP
jgi:hypothetical protein